MIRRMKIKSCFRFCLHAVALCTVFSPFCSFASTASVACAEVDAVRYALTNDITLTANAITTCMEYTYDASGNRTARKLKSSTSSASALRSVTLTGGNGDEEEPVPTGHEKTANLFPEVKITTRYNSTEETLHVDIFGGSIPSKTRTELHNLSGQPVQKWEIVSESNTLDISAHPAGPYLVLIYSGNRHISTLKIVKR